MLKSKDNQNILDKMNQNVKNELSNLEKIHREDLDKSYLLYSVIRDYYHIYLKSSSSQDKTPVKICDFLINTIGIDVYNRHKILIKKAYINSTKMSKIQLSIKHFSESERKTSTLVINAIKENMEYFKRLLQILEDIFVKKSIESLVNEIKLEQQYLI